ncbi:tetratricopeptide repeat protein [Propionivibrio soli]|uniref:tetratricopeptide repeat protein n=1 Tax=Propionivibrio soli TaxID=2976531 RepID=UPI0021E77D0B|nr:tetratricopeptide repeat protein [Propionivibrio soli]
MSNQSHASQLAKQAFDFWQGGQAERAVPLYQEALRLADPQHLGLPDYHGEFAGTLSTLGRYAEAREQYQLALAVQRQQDQDEFTSGVVVARHFLAEHYLHCNEPLLALETVEPSLKNGVTLEWLLRYTKAVSLSALGRPEEACAEAAQALEKAPSKEKREELSVLFSGHGVF